MSKQKMRGKVIKPCPSLFVLGVFGVFALLQPLFECRLAFLTVVVGSDFRNQMSCKGIDDRLKAVIYARFSSRSQREQSNEGQLKTCYKFAADNGYTVIGVHIDRAQSGTNDNRAEFQRLIADSDKHTLNAVIVYQLDRFARNAISVLPSTKARKRRVVWIDEKDLADRFICEVISLIHVHEIFHEAL